MAQFVDVLDVNASVVALPSIARDFGLSESDLQWVVTAYVLVFAGCLLVSGRLADTYGRRRVFALGLGVFTAASLACGLAPGAAALVRGARSAGPGRRADRARRAGADRRRVPGGRDRQRASPSGPASPRSAAPPGLVLGGVIADALGWRWVFLDQRPDRARRACAHAAAAAREPDRPAAARSARARPPRRLGLALLVAALSGCPLALAGAAALVAVFVRRDRAAAEPLVVRDRTVAIAAAAGALLTATTSGTGVLASLYLQGDAGLGPSAAGLALLPLSVRGRRRLDRSARGWTSAIALVGAGCARAGARRRRERRRLGRARRLRARRGVGGGDDARHLGRRGGRSRRASPACSAPPRRSAPRSASPRSCWSGPLAAASPRSPARSLLRPRRAAVSA